MKLHLPTRLRAAVLACVTAVAALASTIGTGVITTGSVAYTLAVSQAQAVEYSGTIYTLNGTGNISAGPYVQTTYDSAMDTFTLTETQTTGWNSGDLSVNSIFGSISADATHHTMRLTSGGGREIRLDFNPLRLGGLVVDEGATGYSIISSGNAARGIYFGNTNGTAAVSTIHEDFTLSMAASVGRAESVIHFNGTQDWTIDSDKTVTLTPGGGCATVVHGDAALTLNGGGTLNITSALTLNLSGMTTSSAPLISVADGTLQYDSITLADYSALDGGVYSLVSTTAEQASAMAAALNMTEGQFVVTADNGTLKLTVQGGPAPVTGVQNIAYGAATRADGYEVMDGGNLKINNGSGGQGGAAAGAVSNIGPVTVHEGGTLTIWACQFSQKNLATDNKVNIANDITIEDGGKVFIQDGSYNFTGTLAVSGNGLFESQYAKGYTFSALSGNSDATLTIQQDNQDANTATLVNLLNANTAFEGTLNMKNVHGAGNPVSLNVVLSNADSLGKAKVVFDSASTAANNLVLNTAAANVGSISGAGSIITSSELTGGGVTAGTVTEGTLTITGMPAAGAAAFSGTVSGGVTLNVASGATLSLGNVTLGHTIANSGTVNIADGSTITLSTLAGWEGDSSLSEGDNGFMTISKLYVVQGGTINAANVSVAAGGDTKTLAEDGSIAFSGDTDYSVYYLNTGSKALADITAAASGSLEKVVMKNNAMLTGITSAEGLSGDIGFENETEFLPDGTIPTTVAANATYGNLTGSGTITINNGSTLTVTGVNSASININLSSAASKVVFSKGVADSVTMTMGNITASSWPDNFGREVVVENGVTLNIAALTNSWGMKGITVDGVLNVAGELKYSTGGNSAGTNVIGGSGSITAGSLTIANASSINTINANSLTVTGATSIGRSTEVTGGTTTLQGATAINANMTLAGGTLNLAGETTIGANGALNVNGGTLVVDGNLNLKATLENKASVTLNGSMTASAASLESIGDTGYTDEKAPESGNGYLNGSFYLVKAAEGASATAVLGADAVAVLDGQTLEHSALTADGGSITCTIASDIYYVNDGTVVYGAATNSAADERTESVVMNGGSLTLEQALNEGVTITAAKAGTLTIGEDIELSASDLTRNATVTLAGTGTYTATTAADLTNLAYGQDWAGTVAVDAGEGNTIAIGTYPASGTLNILSGTVDHNHGNVATLGCDLNIAEGATYQDYGNYKWALNLNGALLGEGTMLSKPPTTAGQGDGSRQVVLNGNTADFTGEWQLLTIADTNAGGNRRVSGRLNSADGVFGGVVSFVSGEGEQAPSAEKTSSELRLMKSMTIGGVKGSLGTIVAESADTELVIDVAAGKDLTFSGKLDMGKIKTLTVTGDGTQTFSGITSTGAGAIVVGSDGAPLFAGDNSISNLTIESGATLSNEGSITITGNLTLSETLDTDTTLTLGEGATIIVTDSTAFEQSSPTKRVDALGRETAVTGNGFDADGGITLVKGTAAAGVDGSASIDGTTYTVTDGVVDMATFTNYFVTSTDAEITAETVAAYAAEKGAMLSSITVSNGAEFTVDAETMTVRTTDGGGTLTVTDSLYNLELGADTQVDNTAALYTVAVTGGESTISGEGTVGTVTVNGGKLTVEEAGTGAVTMTDGSASIGGDATTLMVSGGSLTVDGNSGAVTATGGTTTVGGNVGGAITTNGEGTQVNVGGNVSGSITTDNGEVKFLASETAHSVGLMDLSHGDTALGHVAIAAGASVVQSGDLWMSSKNAGVLLEEGGSLTTKQGSVTVTGLEGSGSVTISEGQNYYQTGADKFVFTNVAVSTANDGATSLATHLVGAEVENLGAGLLTVISDGEGSITSVAATNGNVAVNGRTAETAIALDSVTLGAGKTLTLGGDTNIGELNVDLATYVTEVPTEALTLISTAAGKTLTFDTLDTSAKSVTIGEKTYVAQLALNDNALTLAYTEANNLYWNGGNGNFSDSAWAVEGGSEAGELPFIPGMGVTFDGTGGDIVVDSAVSVGSMLVSGDYSFTSVGNLTITGTLTVDGATAAFDAMPGADSIVVNAESTLDLSGVAISQDLLVSVGEKVTGDGTVVLRGNGGMYLRTDVTFNTDVTVDGGLWLKGRDTNSSVTITEGHTLSLSGDLNVGRTASIVVDGGTLDAAGGISLGHTAGNYPGKLTMSSGEIKTTTITLLADSNTNVIEITGGKLTITGENAFNNTGANTTVSISDATLTTDGEHSWTLNHGATLTDVTVDAAEGTSITIGGADLTTTINGTLTNKGAMAIGSDLSMGTLANEGSIDLGSHALTLTETTEQGGTITGTGSLTLAAGGNAFTAVTGSSVDLTTTGATLSVSDALSMGNITLGALTNTVQAGSLTDTLGLTIGADALSSGTHAVVTLGTAYEGSATLTVGDQTFTLGDDAAQLTDSNKMVQLVMNEAGTAMNIIVSYAGGVWDGGEPGEESAEWTEETVPGDTVTFDGEHGAPEVVINSNVEMETIVVSGGEDAKEYTFTGDGSVTTEMLDMSGNGTLTVNNEMGAAEATLSDNASLTVGADGSLSIDTLTMDTEGSLTVNEDGSLTIGSIAESGSTKDVTIVNDGTLTVTGNAAIDSLTGEGALVITEDGTVTLTDTTTLGDVSGAGALVVDGDLTADSVSGNAVTADSVTLNSVGNEISTLTTDKLVVTTVEGIGAETMTDPHANAYVEADEVQAKTQGNKITIVLTDNAVSQVTEDMGVHTQRDYLIIDSEQDMTDTFVLDATQQQGFLKDGIKTDLALGSVHLDARKLTAAEKSWTIGADETEGGLVITTTGADAYSELDTDGVENAMVDGDTTLSLTGEPTAAVLKNLTSVDGATLTVTGDAGDTVTIKSTAAAADYDVPGAHDGGLVVNGLTAVADTAVPGKATQLASLELTNGAVATTTTGSHWSVGALNAASDAAGTIEGDFTVTGTGGVYKGAYSENGANVTVSSGAEQTLASGENLSVSGKGFVTLLPQNGVAKAGSLTMNGGTLSIGEAALSATGTLAGGTLLADINVTDIVNGTPRTLTMDGSSLNLSGTTIVLTQTDTVPGTLTIDPTSDLVLAVLGDDTLTSAATKVVLDSPTLSKYFKGASVHDGLIVVDRNTSYFTDMAPAVSANAAAGLAMLDEALVTYNPQATNPTGDLAGIMNSLESGTADVEKLAAGVAGSGLASVSVAMSNDVDRQLRAIRNRTTTMGVDQCVVNEDMPYFNAWINAEGDFRKMDSEGSKAGYEMNSWGGTVGFDVDCTPRFTCGMALSAMYGDFKSNDVDHVDGDIDTYYVSAFARYASHRWTHTAVATFGLSDLTLNRTVNYAGGAAHTKGDTDGMSFGAMYELGYVMALDEDMTTCLQPVVNVSFRHISVDGYTESGSDAALHVDDMDANVVTFGAGARLQSIVGESIYNRSSIFECRAMLKVDAGDTEGEAKTALNAVGGRSHTVKSAEMGKIGAEIGAGLTVPVGQESGSIFVDGSAEFRSGYTGFNATVGYRVNF